MSTTTFPLGTAVPAAAAGVDARADFITRTYLHLAVAVLAFVALEFVLFSTGLAYPIASAILSVNWLLPLGAFMLVSWLATRTAHRTTSSAMQYLALGGFVAAEALLFVPMLALAEVQAPGAIQGAAYATLIGFAVLTGIAFYTRKDFRFLRTVLIWGGVAALGLIVAGTLFGFQLGTFFAVGMVGFAGAAILYDTSNVLHHYPTDRHVGAALQLFASVALMFWYLLTIFSRD